MILPARGLISPVNALMVVVFPAPFDPNNPTNSPSSMKKSIPARAGVSPNDLVNPSTITISVTDPSLQKLEHPLLTGRDNYNQSNGRRRG